MFVIIDERTSIPKNGEKKSFSYETKVIISFYPNKENDFMVPNLEKKGDYYVNPSLSELTNEL